MKIFLIIIIGTAGILLVIRGFYSNIKEIRKKPKSTHSFGDKFFNYPLMVLWYGYLLVFFAGLIVNNLIIK